MIYSAIVHRTLLHPTIREWLAEFAEETGMVAWSSPIGFVQFDGRAELGSPMSATPFPNGLLLRSELVARGGKSSFELLKSRKQDWNICFFHLSDCPVIDWDRFKSWALEKVEDQPQKNMVIAKLCNWHPKHPQLIDEECRHLGFNGIEAVNNQLLFLVTNGGHPAGEKCDIPVRKEVDDFDDFLLNEDGTSVSYAILKPYEATRAFLTKLKGKKLLQIGGVIYMINFNSGRQHFEFRLMEEQDIIHV